MAKTYTYIIHLVGTNSYKIGQSKDPLKRLKQLQTGSADVLKLVTYVQSDKWLEKRLHKMFFFSHKRGEWFTLSDAKLQMLLEYLEERYSNLASANS